MASSTDAARGSEDDAAPTGAIRATLDQLEAAERELRAAEEARRVRAEELDRVAREAELSIAAAIDACVRERDELTWKLDGLEGRIRELEGMRTRAQIPSSASAAPRPAVADAGTDAPVPEPAVPGPAVPEPALRAYIGDDPKADPGTSYEDEWYAALKQRREAELDEDDD